MGGQGLTAASKATNQASRARRILDCAAARPSQTQAPQQRRLHPLGGRDEGGRRGAGHGAAHQAGQAGLLVQLGGQHLGRSLYKLRQGGRAAGGRGLARWRGPTLLQLDAGLAYWRPAPIVGWQASRRSLGRPARCEVALRAAAQQTHSAAALPTRVDRLPDPWQPGQGSWGRVHALRGSLGIRAAACPAQGDAPSGSAAQGALQASQHPRPAASARAWQVAADGVPCRLPGFSEAADLLPASAKGRGRRPVRAGRLGLCSCPFLHEPWSPVDFCNPGAPPAICAPIVRH